MRKFCVEECNHWSEAGCIIANLGSGSLQSQTAISNQSDTVENHFAKLALRSASTALQRAT